MNRKEFEEALMSTIVEYISDQVILRYAQACKKATVLFSGALIGYKDAVTSLNELKKDGWTLTAVLSKAAGEVITEERIKNDIDPDAIYVEGAPVNGRQIVDDSQFVIIPSLTINTAAKVANCISDNLLTNMISRAMATGKPIVAAIDGCCPDNKVREQLGFKVTEAYKAKMRHNLEDMLAYGITLTTDYSLCSKVNEVFSAKISLPALDNSKPAPKKERIVSAKMEPAVQSVSQPVKKAGASGSVKLDKKVIGRVDIAKNARFKTIVVRQDALVTGLAKDEALNRGITIVKEEVGEDMYLGKVIGTVVSTVKAPSLTGSKFLIVEKINQDLTAKKQTEIAVDTVGAGDGETVIVVGGSSARMSDGKKTDLPVDAAIVGIVDTVEISQC